jgi:hypothetical protein
MRLRLLLLPVLVLGSSCSLFEQPSGLIPRWTSAWRDVATSADRERLTGWRSTFVDALAAARKAGHGAEIDAQGALLQPDAALASPAIPAGIYRCRVIKLGAKSPATLGYVAYPGFACRVRPDHQLQRLDKLTGSQRYVGLVFPGDPLRNIFLGTLVLGDETRSMQYGQDQGRDIAGYVERIADHRWRLIMPEPQFESQMDVMELVPSP